MVPIAERPPEVDDRRVPGHWEGDLLIGAGGLSAIATLVERQTPYVLLARLGYDRSTTHVVEALEQRIGALPSAAGQVADLGPGTRALRPPTLHQPDRHPGVLLRAGAHPGSARATSTPTDC